MGKSPLVSVIMPVYNTEKYLWDAIESILNQTLKDFEFIIIDDGSTDNSWKIIQSYSEKDKRIKAYQNKKNRGISYTRSLLVQKTKTNFIAMQDSDDISLPQRLNTLYKEIINKPDCWVIGWNTTIIDEKNNQIGYRKYPKKAHKNILQRNNIAQPSCLVRKSVFIEVWWYDPTLNIGEDYDLWLKMLASWYKIKNIDKNIIMLRIRKGQTKESVRKTLKATIQIQKRAVKEYWIKASLWDKMYRRAEKILWRLPEKRIFRFFTKMTYEWKG